MSTQPPAGRPTLALLARVLALALAAASPLPAQVWTGAISNQWSNAGNWSGGVPGAAATGTFNASTANDPNLTAAAAVGQLLFQSGSDAETFTGATLTLNGVSGIGLDNQSGVTQSFSNTLLVAANQGWNAGSGDFAVTGVTLSANLTLTGASNFTFGGTLVNNGGNRTFTNDATGTVTLSGINITTANQARTLTLGGSGDTFVSGAIANGGAGVGSLIKTGSGTVTLGSANTYTGTTTIGASNAASGGTLRLAAADALANNTVTVFAGTLDLNNQGDTIGALNLGGGAAGTSAQVSTGTGTLTLGGNVTFNATNNADGAVVSGQLNLGTANRIITVNDSLAAGLDLAITAGIAATNRNLTVTGAGTGEISGSIATGSGTLTKSGTGTLILSNANTYTGATSVTGGVLVLRHGNALGSTAAGTSVTSGEALHLEGGIAVGAEALTITGTGVGATGALRSLSGDNSWAGNITLSGNTTIQADADSLSFGSGITGAGRSLTVTGDGDVSVAGAVDLGSGGLVKTGAGTFTIGATSNVTGTTIIGASGGASGGTLRLGAGNILGDNTTTLYAGTLDLNNQSDTIGALNLGGGAAGTSAQVTTGTGTLTLGGNLTYSATNNADGAVVSGQLNLGTANRIITVNDSLAAGLDLTISAGIAATNRNLTVTGAGTSEISGSIATGSGTLTKSGTGTLILSNANTYTGATSVSGGVLVVRHGNALGSTAAGTTVTAGEAIHLEGGIAVGAEALTLAGTGIGTTGALRNLSGDNSWAGTLTLSANTTIMSDAGTLTLSGDVSGATRTLTVGGAGNTVVDGAIATTTGGLIKQDAGTLTLSGANTYTGATNITGGTLQLGASGVLADVTAVTVAAGATLDVNDQVETIASLAGAGQVLIGTGQLISAGNTSTVFSGQLDGTGGFTKQGTGILTLSSTTDFDFDGTFELAGGTLRLTDLNLGLGTLLITGNTTIDFAGTSSLTVGTFSIAGGVTLTITNWTNAADYFIAGNWLGATPNVIGATPMTQVEFTGFTTPNTTRWQSYDDQITPVPEPSTYGALLLLLSGGWMAWLRRKRCRAVIRRNA